MRDEGGVAQVHDNQRAREVLEPLRRLKDGELRVAVALIDVVKYHDQADALLAGVGPADRLDDLHLVLGEPGQVQIALMVIPVPVSLQPYRAFVPLGHLVGEQLFKLLMGLEAQ